MRYCIFCNMPIVLAIETSLFEYWVCVGCTGGSSVSYKKWALDNYYAADQFYRELQYAQKTYEDDLIRQMYKIYKPIKASDD